MKQKQSNTVSPSTKATIEAVNELQSFVDDWQSLLGINAQTKATMEKNWSPKKWTARYTAKAELLEIQDYFKRLSGKKMTAGEIIDHALEQLANDIGAHYALDDKED